MDLIDLTLTIQLNSSLDMQDCISSANEGAGSGDERWRSLWREPMQQVHLDSIHKLVTSLQPCKNLLVLGIGGSALGTRALHCALRSADSPSLFVLDNIDPKTVQDTIDFIKANDPSLSQTVVAVVSKSGETAEVLALCMAVNSALSDATFVAITGQQGTLRQYAISNDWATLPVPEGVGGRFSVLSPVSLFPAAMCGINIQQLLDGARAMDDRCMQLNDNPAASLCAGLVNALQEGRNIHVMMPYSDRLSQFAQWYVQLWAESLGKINNQDQRVGPTPVAAVGTTDQHSMLQLWREGPMDKVIGFVDVSDNSDVQLGEHALGESQSWLAGQSLRSLLQAERVATEQAVQDAGQATWAMTLPALDAYSIGQFIALWQVTVAFAGRLMNLNPYDQPGVELGKEFTRNAFD